MFSDKSILPGWRGFFLHGPVDSLGSKRYVKHHFASHEVTQASSARYISTTTDTGAKEKKAESLR